MYKENVYLWKNLPPQGCERCNALDMYNPVNKQCFRCSRASTNIQEFNLYYSISFRDFINANVNHYFRTPIAIILNTIILLFLSLIIIGVTYGDSLLLVCFAFIKVISIVLPVLWVLQVYVMVLASISKKNRTIFTNYRLTIKDKCLIEESPYIRTEIKWNAINKIRKINKSICIYYAQHSMVLIPLKNRHNNDIEYLYNKLRDKWKNSF